MTRLLYINVCLRTRQDTISYSSDIYSSETGTSIDGYGKGRQVWQKKDEYAVWSMEYGKGRRVRSMEYGKGRRVWSISGLLLVLVCRSVPQDAPQADWRHRCRVGLLYSPSTALSQSAVAYVHVAPGRPISDRLSHCSASDKRSTFCYTVTWPCVNIC